MEAFFTVISLLLIIRCRDYLVHEYWRKRAIDLSDELVPITMSHLSKHVQALLCAKNVWTRQGTLAFLRGWLTAVHTTYSFTLIEDLLTSGWCAYRRVTLLTTST